MRSSLLSRLAGVAVIAATALALAAPASAAPAAMRMPTTLSIHASKMVDQAGHPVVISGTLKAGMTGLAGRPVALERAVFGHRFVIVAVRFTNRSGMVAFTRRPIVTVTYRLMFFGSVRFAPSRSATVTVRVIR
jgi:hypothetical protein